MDLNELPKPSCLDSAYERKAIDDGLVQDPVFPENRIYLTNKIANRLMNDEKS